MDRIASIIPSRRRDLGSPPLRVLSMVRHLHEAGYERLRICAGHAHTGEWRCFIAPAANMLENGWLLRGADGVQAFLTEAGPDYFDWEGSAGEDARSLAISFLFRNTDQLRLAEGRDPAYVRWFADRLDEAEQGRLPAQFCGGTLGFVPDAPPPPPLPADIVPMEHDFPTIATDDLSLADLPPEGAPYEQLYPFALTIDGYFWSMATGHDLQELADAMEVEGFDGWTLDQLRMAAFFWQRREKWASSDWEAQQYIPKVRSAIEAIRRAFNSADCEMTADSR